MSKKSLRIGFLSQEIPQKNEFGGIGFHFWILAKSLVKKGHQVTVFFDGTGSFVRDGVTVIGIWSGTEGKASWLQRIAHTSELLETFCWSWVAVWRVRQEEAKQPRFDIFEAAEYHAAPMLLLLGRARLVFSLHGGKKQTAQLNQEYGSLQNKLIFLLEWLTIHFSRYSYTISRRQAQYTSVTYSKEITMVIPNAIDTTFFSPAASQHPGSLGHGGKPRSKKYFLFVGRIELRKGVEPLLTAYTRLVGQNKRPELLPDLVMVGADMYQLGENHTLSLTDYLQRSVPEQIRSRIHYFPHMNHSQLREYYQAAVCCIFPSLDEPFGNVVGEAVSTGAAVIVSSTVGAAEWLSDRTEVYKTEPTAEALYTAMSEVTRRPSQLKKLRSSARKAATRDFAPSKVVQQLEEYYRQILGQ